MATTITGKLNKAASQFQAGESTGFGLRIGVKFYDRESKTDQWTNFECAVFAKAPAQIQFYQQALIEGAIVEIAGDKLKIKQFQGNNGLNLSIEILDAKLGFVFSPNAQPQQQGQQQRPAPQQQHNQAPQGQRMPAGPAQNRAPQQQYNQAPQGGYNQAPQGQQQYNQAPQGQQQYNQAPQSQQQYNQAPQDQQFQQGMHNGQPAIDFDPDIPF